MFDDMSDFYSSIGIPDITGNGDINAVDGLLYEDMIRDLEYARTGEPLSPSDPLYDPYYQYPEEENNEESDDDSDETESDLFSSSLSPFGEIYGTDDYDTDILSISAFGDSDQGLGSDPDSMDYEFAFPLDPHDSY